MSILLKSCRDFELCEDALQEALAEALRAFAAAPPPDALPAWLITVARRKLIDKLRKQSRELGGKRRDLAFETLAATPEAQPDSPIPDERLTLIFLCCHPSLPEEQRIALTLHAVCGLSTRAIAKGFLCPEPTMAQRITRAKRRIKETGMSFEMPRDILAQERLESAMRVVYLIFAEGYRPTGECLVRDDLCAEAMFLARLVESLLRKSGRAIGNGALAEVLGLLALMSFVLARNRARTDPSGAMKMLHEQERSRWDHDLIAEGKVYLEKALSLASPGPYQIQAAIQALHLEAPSAESTDWPQIAALYNALLAFTDTAVVRVNYAVAMSYVLGPAYALEIISGLADELSASSIYYLARADLEERLGDTAAALEHYRAGLRLEQNSVIRQSVLAKMRSLENPASVTLERNFDCPPELLWRFWTDPGLMRHWFGSDPRGTVLSASADPREGGGFSVCFANADKTEHTCCGAYLKVRPFSELCFTWYWKGREQQVETVTITFSPTDRGVDMAFTHQDIDPATSHDYRAGWASTFDKLRLAIGRFSRTSK